MKRRLRHQIQVASPGLFFLWPPTTEAWSHSFCLFSRLVFVLVSTVQLKATNITQHNPRNLTQSLANQLNLHLPKLVAILASFWHFQNCLAFRWRKELVTLMKFLLAHSLNIVLVDSREASTSKNTDMSLFKLGCLMFEPELALLYQLRVRKKKNRG